MSNFLFYHPAIDMKITRENCLISTFAGKHYLCFSCLLHFCLHLDEMVCESRCLRIFSRTAEKLLLSQPKDEKKM